MTQFIMNVSTHKIMEYYSKTKILLLLLLGITNKHNETQICSVSVQRPNLLTFNILYAYSLQVPVVRGGGPC